jgi:F-type H+-transporting ATPase subunit b
MPKFLDPAEAEFWVLAGLLIFLAIAFWKGRGAIFGTLDAKAVKVKADLDEAARLRAEAERLLTQLQAERADAERRSAEMLANAEAEAKRSEADAKVRLEETIARRQQLAERRIEQAERQALADVKAAAAEMAAVAAERVLAARVARGEPDPLIDRGIGQLAGRFN